MPEKSLEQRIAECTTSQQIADLQAERSGSIQRVEGGSRALALPVMNPGRVLVQCTRDGIVDLPAEQLVNALKIDPDLKVIAMGTTNSELEQRLSQCRDSNELAQLMVEARQGKI
jgi:hypothetical protein